ncbi:hypothetical protein D3C77_688870 [compost metagenome]
MLETEPPLYNLLLPGFENIQVLIDFALLHLQLNPVYHIIGLGSQNIYERNLIALFVRSNWIVQRHIFTCLLQ